MSVWICADCNFLENPKKDSMLISNWNSSIKANDMVLIIGTFFSNKVTLDAAKHLAQQLNGKKCISDYTDDYMFNQDELKEIGFSNVSMKYCFWNNDDRIVMVPNNKLIKLQKKKPKKEQTYIAAARSITGQTQVLQDKLLSLSFIDWANYPIKYESVPELLTNMLEFKKLEV